MRSIRAGFVNRALELCNSSPCVQGAPTSAYSSLQPALSLSTASQQRWLSASSARGACGSSGVGMGIQHHGGVQHIHVVHILQAMLNNNPLSNPLGSTQVQTNHHQTHHLLQPLWVPWAWEVCVGGVRCTNASVLAPIHWACVDHHVVDHHYVDHHYVDYHH